MAYMPAGEEEDFDSDDGFIDSESYNSEMKGFKPESSRFSTEHIQNKQAGNVSEKKFCPWSRRSETSSKEQSSEAASAFPRYQSTNVLSMEDFKLAVMKDNTELMEKCLSQGLNVNEPLRCSWTVLMYAANYGRPDLVRLLLKNGANPNYHCDMFTPLMCTCSAHSHSEEQIRECLQILAEAGADVNAKDRLHTTPLMMASKEGYASAVKELIKHGADVNRQDSHGWTALTWATQRSAKAVVVELLNSGADPNIQHLDKLTVKDLAAHLPTDEMLALLEHRPASLVSGSGDMALCTNKVSESESGLQDANVRSTDLRYGELEVFLLGLDLAHLVSLFQQQLIDLNLLMTLTEQDLINAGVGQLGARKKLLDAVQALHKKDWQPSSLVSIHFNKQIRCSDAVAILANSSKHLRYIGSTVIYVREQLRRHPGQITQPTDQVSTKQLVRHTEDAIKNAKALKSELERLQSELVKEMKKRNVDPPDFVVGSKKGIRTSYRIKYVCSTVVVGLCMSALLWYNRASLQKLAQFVPTKTYVV